MDIKGLPLFDLVSDTAPESTWTNVKWDIYDQHIIAAKDIDQARQMAIATASGEGTEVWKQCDVVIISDNSTFMQPTIVCSSFNAG